ncbi:MAG TPA: sodium ion-translocating decarboxylase subunit beta [Bacteroidales bacterium]|nr:sodium ion-translocating decarboxylase subunit beta [Bacteroidales bacterium]
MRKFATVFTIMGLLYVLSAFFGQAELYAQTAGASSGSLANALNVFWKHTGFSSVDYKYLLMIAVGLFFIYLAIRYNYEPLLLVPIGTGIIIGNIPLMEGFQIGIYEEGSVLNYLYFGVLKGVYPPLIFLGIGAMTDFSSMISNPRLMLLGAAAQLGVFGTFIGAMAMGFEIREAAAISIIGGADGPTAIFASSKLAPHFIGSIAIAAYSYMALVPVIQPPIMNLLVSKKERLIKMKPPRAVSKLEKILFPLIGLILTLFISPSALPLLGMLFFGNLLKESGVTNRLAETARTSLIDIITIVLGLTVGASTQAVRLLEDPVTGEMVNKGFLTSGSIKIFVLGAFSFAVATAGGLLFAKIMNLFLKEGNKVNPLIGAAGVSAVPASARVAQQEGLKADPSNHLLMHAMAPNVSGVIGSAVAAGIMMNFLL